MAGGEKRRLRRREGWREEEKTGWKKRRLEGRRENWMEKEKTGGTKRRLE